MPRAPVAADRLPSQRATSDFRELQTRASELEKERNSLRNELRLAMNNRNYYESVAERYKKELKLLRPPSHDGRRDAINKLKDQSSNFYDHVEYICSVFRRYDVNDVPTLATAVLAKLGREKQTDLSFATLITSGMKSARETLLHAHELKIADHLRTNVYTADHFSLLRLVGKISKRVCGLIEQSIKWQHFADGTKKRQVLCPGARVTVPAPSLFSVSDISAAEAESERRTQLVLEDHPDRKGADIGGKAYALDRALYDSLTQVSRSGGMATDGTKENPHLACRVLFWVACDLAGVTM